LERRDLRYTVTMDDITPPNKQKRSRIEELDNSLYDPTVDHEQKLRRPMHSPDIELEHEFQDEEYEELINARPKFKLPTSLFKKFFIAVSFFFVIAVGIAAVSLYEADSIVSEDQIAMEILAQPFVDGGEELELRVNIQNFNEQSLQLPDLVLSYPKDSTEDSEMVFMRRSLNDIPNEGRVTEIFDLSFFGQEGSTRTINAELEYRIEGSSSIFEKEAEHTVIIRSTPTQLAITAPDSIIQNQEFEFAVDVSSNSNKQIRNTTLAIDYPEGFNVIETTPEPDFAGNRWYIDSLTDQVEQITVRGTLNALKGQARTFRAIYGQQSALNKNQIETVFNATRHTVEIEKPFIETRMQVNRTYDLTSAVRGGGDIPIDIEYMNTLPGSVTNAQIIVRFDGELFDPNAVRSGQAFYNSADQEIIFDSSTHERLSVIRPGESGEFTIEIQARDLVSAEAILDNPLLTIDVDIIGTLPSGDVETATSVSSHTVLGNSDISIIPKTLHQEGPFDNTGPMPPVANQTTDYTLLFQATNSSNDITDARMITTLPRYVEWSDGISPSGESRNVEYNPATREIIWEIGELSSGIGVGTTPPRQLYVQVAVTPSTDQIGKTLALTTDIIMTAEDAFTESELRFKKSPLRNRIDNNNEVGAKGLVR